MTWYIYIYINKLFFKRCAMFKTDIEKWTKGVINITISLIGVK